MQLYNKDSYEFIKTIPDNSVDLILTDPPYDVSVNHDGGRLYHSKGFDKSNKDLVNANIDKGYDINYYGKEFVRILKNINIYIWCNKSQIPDYFNFYVNNLGCNFDIICWHKHNALPTYSNKYLSDTEYCLYFRKGGYCEPKCYEDAKTFYVQAINSQDKQLYNHPTIKPLNIIESMVKNSSKEGDVVFDPFMGSGTTGVACKLHNRDFIGCEINPDYFKICEERINETVQKKSISSLF